MDVLLGGGRSKLGQTITGGPDAGETGLQSAQDGGYRYVADAAGLAAAQPGGPVPGLFADGMFRTLGG